MVGGYVMVDCKGLDLTKGETPQTITGLYAEVTKAVKTGKEIIAHNCKWGDLDVTPIPVFAIKIEEDVWYCTSSTLQILVHANNSVTIVNMAPATNNAKKGSSK